MATIPATDRWFEPSSPQSRLAVRLVAAVVWVNGVFALLEVLFSRLPGRLEMLVPFDYDLYGRLFGLFAGFLLIYFASQLAMRKRLAWWIAVFASASLLARHIVFFHWHLASGMILPSLSLVVLLALRREFVVGSEPTSVTQGLRLLALCLVVALAYGSIGFTRLAPHDFVPAHRVGLVEGVGRTLQQFSLLGNPDLVTHAHRARWFIDSLNLLGGVSIAFAVYSLFRPLRYRYRTLPQERERARGIIERYGRSSEDEFKLWPEDKAYFFGTSGESVLAYHVHRGVALVLGEPVGPDDEWPALLESFREFCSRHGWAVGLVYLPGERRKVFERAGFRTLKIGEDAIVSTAHFVATTRRNKHFRGVMNKFARLGYRFEVVEAPIAPDILRQCAAITRSWLKTNGRRERGFALGYHDRAYLERNRLYLVWHESGQLVAFANAITTHRAGQETIDLMRYRPTSETGVMDFLLASIIEHLAAAGVAEFSLGLAPMAGVGVGPEQPAFERMIALGGRLGLGGFAYEGLRRFKDKFDPEWQPRYLAYDHGPAGLARCLLALNSLLGG